MHASAIRYWSQKVIILSEITSLVLAVQFWFIGSAPYAFALFLIMALVVIPFVPPYLINRAVTNNPELFLSETTLIPDNDKIQINDTNSQIDLKWETINRWFETARYIFVICPGSRGLIIPKRTLSNMQYIEFKTLLYEKIRPSPKNIQPNEYRYGFLPLVLSLVSLFIIFLPLTLDYLLGIFNSLSNKCFLYIPVLAYLTIFSWLPALITAIFTFKMSRRTKNMLLGNINQIFSFMALFVSLLFSIIVIFALVFSFFQAD